MAQPAAAAVCCRLEGWGACGMTLLLASWHSRWLASRQTGEAISLSSQLASQHQQGRRPTGQHERTPQPAAHDTTIGGGPTGQ